MSNSLTLAGGAQLPAHLAGFAVEANSDLAQGVSLGFPILSYKGKVWHLCEGDSRQLIANDQDEPVPSIEVVILKANPNIGKTYYPDGYEEGSSERPVCYSNDSVAPAADSPQPQSNKCAICPHNQFGSKITENGARGKACSDFRRLAVAPSGDLERAMLLRVPAASLKELVAYASDLNKRHVPYQAIVTRVGFDHTVAYPKLSFKAMRYLDEQEVGIVREMMDSDLVASITSVNAVSPSVATAPAQTDELGPAPAHVQQMAPQAEPAPRATTARRTKPTEATVDEIDAAITAAPTPAPAPAPAPAAEPPKKSAGAAFGGSAKAAPAAAPAPPPAAQPQAEKTTVLVAGAMAELDAALAGFDDA